MIRNALEMRKFAETINYDELYGTVSGLMKVFKAECYRGCLYCYLEHEVPEDVLEYLEDLGYGVRRWLNNTNEPVGYTITWSPAKESKICDISVLTAEEMDEFAMSLDNGKNWSTLEGVMPCIEGSIYLNKNHIWLATGWSPELEKQLTDLGYTVYTNPTYRDKGQSYSVYWC